MGDALELMGQGVILSETHSGVSAAARSAAQVTQSRKTAFRSQVSGKAKTATDCVRLWEVTHHQQLYEPGRYQRLNCWEPWSGFRMVMGLGTGNRPFSRMVDTGEGQDLHLHIV